MGKMFGHWANGQLRINLSDWTQRADTYALLETGLTAAVSEPGTLPLPAPLTTGTLVSWENGVSGQWNDANDWVSYDGTKQVHHVPTSSDTVDIGVAGQYTVSISGNAVGYAVNIDDATATLAVNSKLLIGTELYVGAGSLVVNGSGFVSVPGQLEVGGDGTGGMTISGGGTVSTTGLYNDFGNDAGANNTSVVDGPGSRFISTGPLSIGVQGSSSFTVSNSAQIQTAELFIGDESQGNGTLVIDLGGKVTSSGPYDDIGNDAKASGLVTIDGKGSVWTSTAQVTVGSSGNGTLIVSDSGSFSAATGLYIGESIGGVGTLTVTADGMVSTAGPFTVGGNGSGVLNITGGGSVSATGLYNEFGSSSGSTSNVVVNGKGSVLKSTNALHIGAEGSSSFTVSNSGDLQTAELLVGDQSQGNGTLAVESNATVTSSGPYDVIGNDTGASGMVTVDGKGSVWMSAAQVIVGSSGSGTLIVSDSGSFSAATGLYVGESTGGVGTLNVTTKGIVTDSGQFATGGSGSAFLNITGGGTVSTTGLYNDFANNVGSTSTVTIAGMASLFKSTGALDIGVQGSSSVTVSNSAGIQTAELLVGDQSQGNGTLAIESGATVTSAGPYDVIGNDAGASGSVTIDGKGSMWTSTTQITIGGAGDGELTLSNSGSLSVATALFIGETAGGVGTLTVTTGGVATSEEQTIVGGSGSGSLTISGDGQVNAGQLLVGIQNGGVGFILVNSGGVLTATSINIGNSNGGVGSLFVEGGASVESSGALTVTDGSSIKLSIGTITGSGGLSVGAGAVLEGYGVVNGAISDAGTISASDGVLQFTGTISGTGSLTAVAGGTAELEASSALTEAISGAGTLQLDAAKYTLSSGTLAIAYLVVSTGATLSGIGTITGNVVDAGTLSAVGGVLVLAGGESALTGNGVLSAADGATLKLTGGVELTEQISGDGTIELSGANAYTIASTESLDIANLNIDGGTALSGYGTITSDITDTGMITAQGGELVLSGTVEGNGGLQASTGNVLYLTDDGTLNESIFGSGTLQLGGDYTLGSGLVTVGAIAIDADASLSGKGVLPSKIFDGGLVAAAGGTLMLKGVVTGSGSLSAATNAVLDLTTGGALTEAISGAGTLKLDGATPYTLADHSISIANLVVGKGATLSGTGMISSKVTNSGTITASGGKLTFGGATTGAGVLQTATNSVLDLTAGGTLNEAISGGGTLELGGAFLLGGGALAVGTVSVDTGASLTGARTLTSIIADAGTLTANGGTLSVKGAVSGTGVISANSGAVLNLQGGGDFGGNLGGLGKLNIAAAITLTQGASMSAATIVESANVTLGADTALSLVAGSDLDISATAKATVTLSGPSSASFTNSGSLVANGAGTAAVNVGVINNGNVSVGSGTLSFLGVVTNNGVINQAQGVLSIKTTVGGTGTLDVGSTGTLSLLLGAGAGQTVDFTAGTGLLDLTVPIDFNGAIDNFGTSDKIDLLKTPNTGFTYSGGVLTVKDGMKTVASLHFAGSYTQSDFSLTSDGHGGTVITFV